MGTSRRTKRPPLARTRPVRRWSGAIGTPGAPAPGPADAAGAGPPPASRLEEAISRSVDLGYRVVDDYVQQGQRAAQRLSEGRLTGEVVAGEVQELGGRIARYASDFFGAWVELLELAAAGNAARQQATPADEAPKAADPPAAVRRASPSPAAPSARAPVAGSRFRLDIAAARPVEVSLDLRLERASGALRAHDLRSADPRKPRLRGVTVRLDGPEATPILGLRVPDDHPAGAFEGLLLDEATNRPVGSLRVTLGPPGRARRRSGKRSE